MKLSVKSDYAVRAVFGLAQHHQEGRAVPVEKLATEQSIPANYLVQILLELKNQGLVNSQRGKEGGYFLARSPEDISIGDVLRIIHGRIFESPAMEDRGVHPALRSAWVEMQQTLDQTANSLNFKSLVEKASQSPGMYYI